jgi:hypothetical protein
VNRLASWSREQLDSLADRAAEDGEHSVVAAYQVLTRSGSTEAEKRAARRELEAYLESIES